MSQSLQDASVLPGGIAHPSSEGAMDGPPPCAERGDRIRGIVLEYYGFLWRSLRRLGVPEVDVEDAAQKCLWIVAQRIDDVTVGKEKAFLFGVALRVAKVARQACRSRRDLLDDERIAELPSPGPDAGAQLDERRARVMLDAILESLPLDLRTVFVLYEVEELTMAEIATALEIPPGTVASRLRRARETFEAQSLRLQKRLGRRERLR